MFAIVDGRGTGKTTALAEWFFTSPNTRYIIVSTIMHKKHVVEVLKRSFTKTYPQASPTLIKNIAGTINTHVVPVIELLERGTGIFDDQTRFAIDDLLEVLYEVMSFMAGRIRVPTDVVTLSANSVRARDILDPDPHAQLDTALMKKFAAHRPYVTDYTQEIPYDEA